MSYQSIDFVLSLWYIIMNDSKEQFSRIYDEYIEKIYRFVFLKVDSRETAEDITSKVFLKGWEAYNKSKNIENHGSFLYKIARNAVVDHYRGKGKIKTVSSDNVPETVDVSMNVHEKAMFNADMEVVKAAINNLKKDYQDVLIWHYLEDMDTAQIAQILDKSEGTVRVAIHRGLKALKNELVKEG